MIFFATPLSSYSAKVRIVLCVKKLPFEEREPPGGYRSAQYRAVVPMGTMPAIQEGNWVLSESEAISEYLEEEGVLEDAVLTQRNQGNEALLEALKGLLEEKTIAQRFGEIVNPNAQDLILVSGIGSVFPMIRSHTLLNNLHSIVEKTPLVMFYPGCYDEKSLRLFGKIKSDNYYRAFRLIP